MRLSLEWPLGPGWRSRLAGAMPMGFGVVAVFQQHTTWVRQLPLPKWAPNCSPLPTDVHWCPFTRVNSLLINSMAQASLPIRWKSPVDIPFNWAGRLSEIRVRELFEHGAVVPDGPVFYHLAVLHPEDVELGPRHFSATHRTAAHAREPVADMTPVLGVPNHDPVAIKHRGVMIDASVCKALIEPPSNNVEDRQPSLAADVVIKVGLEQRLERRVSGRAPAFVPVGDGFCELAVHSDKYSARYAQSHSAELQQKSVRTQPIKPAGPQVQHRRVRFGRL